MAKGDVVMKFDGQTAQFVQASLAAAKAMEATANKARDLGKSSSAAGEALSVLGDIGKKNLSSLGDAAKGLVGNFDIVKMGINEIINAYDKWGQKIKEVDAAAQNLNKNAARAGSTFGDAGAGPEVKLRLQNMSMPGVSIDERLQLFKKAQEVMPGAGKEELFRLIQMGGEANKAGKDPSAMIGTMGRLSHVFENLSPEQIRDKANKYSELSGGKEFDESAMNAVMRFTASGAGTADEGVGQVLALMKSGASPQTLGKLIDRLAKVKRVDKKELHHGDKAKREKAKRMDEFAQKTMAERFKEVMGNRDAANDFLGDEDASELFPSGSKIAAAEKFDPTRLGKEFAASGGSFADSQKKMRDDPEYSQDLATQNMEEKGRVVERKRYAGVERKLRAIKAFLLARGDNPVLVDKVDAVLKAGTFAGADPVGLLPTDIAIDFQKEWQDEQNEVGGEGKYSAAANGAPSGSSPPPAAPARPATNGRAKGIAPPATSGNSGVAPSRDSASSGGDGKWSEAAYSVETGDGTRKEGGVGAAITGGRRAAPGDWKWKGGGIGVAITGGKSAAKGKGQQASDGNPGIVKPGDKDVDWGEGQTALDGNPGGADDDKFLSPSQRAMGFHFMKGSHERAAKEEADLIAQARRDYGGASSGRHYTQDDDAKTSKFLADTSKKVESGEIGVPDPHLKELKKQTDILEDIHDATQKRSRRETALQNNSVGQE